jgi:hypothetical protein
MEVVLIFMFACWAGRLSDERPLHEQVRALSGRRHRRRVPLGQFNIEDCASPKACGFDPTVRVIFVRLYVSITFA